VDSELRRIWTLIGALSDAFWRRATQPSVSWSAALGRTEYKPESSEEIAIWAELTAPRNREAVRRYVEYCDSGRGTSEYAQGLHQAILTASLRRCEDESGAQASASEEGALCDKQRVGMTVKDGEFEE
jgi:hypothetical protein